MNLDVAFPTWGQYDINTQKISDICFGMNLQDFYTEIPSGHYPESGIVWLRKRLGINFGDKYLNTDWQFTEEALIEQKICPSTLSFPKGSLLTLFDFPKKKRD